jgi:hypothetical protein
LIQPQRNPIQSSRKSAGYSAMPHDLLIAIAAGLSGMLGWGFADFFAKTAIDRVSSRKH